MRRKTLPPMPLVRNYRDIPLVRNYKEIPEFRMATGIKITRKVEFAPHNYKIAVPRPKKSRSE